ncbi:shikimate dehydrogenase [Dongshaea marina]|uniref:shikimate dehydrogenase n=1 Tax=Dongshaea marina TaxID=2047966 RepID=UPI000D3EAD6E|nr:shikimate dehydrogenase [Dongshaea marina]
MDLYGVFGNPVSHSLSPTIHQLFAAQTGQQLEYHKYPAPIDGFADALDAFIKAGGKGCNVTLPFKEQAFGLAKRLSKRATQAKAVNLLSIDSDGTLFGDNSDGAGLVHDLKDRYGSLQQMRVLLLGAGGAARGALGSLLQESPSQLVVANRTLSKAETLVREFSEDGAPLQSSSFEALEGHFDLIINSTSASLSGQLPAISPALLAPDTVCYDMVYGKEITPFNRWAKEQGVRETLDGLGMLVWQAAESFLLWRGVLPDGQAVLNQLRSQLA